MATETSDALTSFLYSLLRDHLPAGVVEKMVRECESAKGLEYTTLSNTYLGNYAKELSMRLKNSNQGGELLGDDIKKE